MKGTLSSDLQLRPVGMNWTLVRGFDSRHYVVQSPPSPRSFRNRGSFSLE
uniref:Uncharacterized protein n=1 Tax=Anguilla anguilla TaxID=7936 RepID=A0A0E9QJI6_ANGAN